MSDAASRAEARRRTWTGGIVRSHAEMDEVSAEFWSKMTGEERLGCVFDMWDEQMTLQDPGHEATARLQRAVGGVRPRGS
jgi:hypothetical protein